MHPSQRERHARLDEIQALETRIASSSALCSVLDRERLACIRRFDEIRGWGEQGARSCAHWLSWRLGIGPGTAREQVRVARALAALPAIDGALGKGNLSFSQVRALTRIAKPENEAKLLEIARHSTAAQLERLCRTVANVVDPAAPSAERFVRRRELASGMVQIEARLRPEEAAVVERRSRPPFASRMTDTLPRRRGRGPTRSWGSARRSSPGPRAGPRCRRGSRSAFRLKRSPATRSWERSRAAPPSPRRRCGDSRATRPSSRADAGPGASRRRCGGRSRNGTGAVASRAARIGSSWMRIT